MKRKILAIFLAVCMAMTLTALVPGASAAWDGTAASSFDGGSGTRTDPYLISTAAELALFRDKVNSGANSLCAQLTGNVDINDTDWTPIGLSAGGYTGIFDGSGYAIQNLQIKDVSYGTASGGSTLYGGGLFGIVGTAGVVKHVNVDGAFSMQKSMGYFPDIGGICGGNLGTIEECFATVNFDQFSISTSGSSGHVNIGGIAGVNAGTIKNCYVVGSMHIKVTFTGYQKNLNVGGIVGYTYVSGSTVENCYAVAPIQVSSNGTSVYVGGVIGCLMAKGTFRNLYANKTGATKLVGNGKADGLSGSYLLDDWYMKSAEYAASLGSAFAQDTKWVNSGYPVLSVMAYSENGGQSTWVDQELSTVDKKVFEELTPTELKNRDLSQPITRAEFCAVSVNLYEKMGGTVYDPNKLTAPFTDVTSDAVLKAYTVGITNGVSATSFDPYRNISRQDMVTMLTRTYKALSLKGWTLAGDGSYKLDYSGVTRFADDSSISPYAYDSVYFMTKNGVIKGFENNTFRPQNATSSQAALHYANATREQSILIAVRMFNHF